MLDPAEIPLRDIHLPDPIAWWPPAMGWWVLLGSILVVIALGGLVWQWHARHRARRAALAELTRIESNYHAHGDTHRLTRELSRLARRMALALDPTRAGAAATGVNWLDHLDRLHRDRTSDDLIKTALTVAPYRPIEMVDGDALLVAFRPWLASMRQPRTTVDD